MIWLRILAFLTACAAAFSAQAQIAFRGATSASAAAGTLITHVGAGAAATRNNCGAINPAIPAGAAGDLLIALVNARENGATVTMAGWNQAYTDTYPGQEFKVFVFWRLATGADPNTVTQSGTCSSIGAQAARFRGVDPVQPLETSPIPAGNVVRQDSNNIDTGAQTTTFNSSMLVVAAFVEDNRTVTEGAGWSQSFDMALNVTRDLGLSLHYRLTTAAGTTTGTNWAIGPSRRNYGILFALRPAPAQLTVNVPAGTAANDVMIASITVRPCSNVSGAGCTQNVTAPAGWTLVRTVDQATGGGTGGFGNRLFVYQRVAAAEPASYTWGINGPPGHAGAVGAIASFQRVDTVSPIVAEAGQPTGNAFGHDAPSIDTGLVTDTMLVATFSSSSSATWTAPAGMTGIVDAASLAVPNDLGLGMALAIEARPAAGPTGPRTATHSNPPASDTGATHMLALRPELHHYSISPASATVATCDYAEITIVGHNFLHTPVNPSSGRVVTLSTSTGTGVWQAALVAGTGAWAPSGLNNGAATYTWPGGESGFTVRLRNTAVTSLTVNVSDGVVMEDATEDPAINFVGSALRVSSGSNAPLAIGTQISAKPSNVAPGVQALFLQAIRTDTSSGSCGTELPNGTDLAFEVGAQCDNPAACTQAVTLTTSAAAGNTVSFVPNGAYPATVNFRFTTADTEAPFTLSYADAGQITLQFRHLLPAPPAATYLQGASNAFVVRPFGFAFTGASHGTTAADAPLAAAGDNFAMTVGAYRWSAADDADGNGVPDAAANLTDNGLTPNFAAATTVTATANLPGIALGTIGRASGAAVVAAGEWSAGTAAIADWRYSEVGNVFLAASAADYLGDVSADVSGNSGNDGTGAAGGYIGRFRPKHFALSLGAVTNRSVLACGSIFTYMNEPLQLAFRLTAQNAQNATTQNYNGAYAKLVLSNFANWSLGARSGTSDLTSRVDSAIAPPAGAWANGIADVVITTAIKRRVIPADNPDGPFAALQFGIAPTDPAPDNTAMNTLDFDADNNAVNERKNIGINTEVRFGRLRLLNAVGSEKLPLPVPIETQYWNGAGFVRNVNDNCTSLPRSAVVLGSYTGALAPAGGNCKTFVQQDPITFAGGLGAITLAAPAGGASGSVLLTPNLGTAPAGNYCDNATSGEDAATPAARSYLLGRWRDDVDPDVDAQTAYDDNPFARAAFGLYGSQPNNFIYFRENY